MSNSLVLGFEIVLVTPTNKSYIIIYNNIIREEISNFENLYRKRDPMRKKF